MVKKIWWGLFVLVFFFPACDRKSKPDLKKVPVNQESFSQKDIDSFLHEQELEVPREEKILAMGVFWDLKGQKKSLADLRGKVVFLNFWATWCQPCRYEMPDMEELHFAMKNENFHMLAVDVGEENPKVQSFLEEFPYSFAMALDPESVMTETFKIPGLPTTLIINPKGELIGKAIGPRRWKEEGFIRFFRSLAKQ